MKVPSALFFVALLSISVAGFANDKKPSKTYMVEFGGPFVATFDFASCGDFETSITFTFGGFWINHPNHPKRGEWEFYHSDWPVTITNLSNPDYKIDSVRGTVMNRHWTGAPFESDPIETGAQAMFTLPGHGVIFRDVGRIRITWSTVGEDLLPPPDFTFQAGHWDTYDGDFQALCAALRP